MLVLGVPLQLRGEPASPGKELVGCAWLLYPLLVSSYNGAMTALLYSVHGDVNPLPLWCLGFQGVVVVGVKKVVVGIVRRSRSVSRLWLPQVTDYTTLVVQCN